jgi:TRAP-type C4-dicarboxylate transport system substrate-binding protein
MRKGIFTREIVLTLAIMALGFAFSTPATAVVKLDMATTYSGQNMHAETCREFAKRVNEALKDQVFITVHEGGALGLKDEDRFTAVADGIVPIQSVLMGAAIGTSPIFGLSTSPFFVKDFKEARLLMEIARPYYEKEAKKHNQLILYTAPWPPSSIHANRPIIKYEDIKGLRIRTYDKNGTDVLKKAGANAVVMSWGDVYPALATKTIDSVLTSSQSAVAGKFWEVLTDTTRVNFAIPLNMININLNTFQGPTEQNYRNRQADGCASMEAGRGGHGQRREYLRKERDEDHPLDQQRSGFEAEGRRHDGHRRVGQEGRAGCQENFGRVREKEKVVKST